MNIGSQSESIVEITKAINSVMQVVGYVQKQSGKSLNYTYVGEKALIEALRPAMVENGLMLVPVGTAIQPLETYPTNAGKSMNLSRIVGGFRLLHTSGEWIDIITPGEGSDSGDKSLNKAQTGALKYALRNTFLIETGDDPDDTASVARANAVELFRADIEKYAQEIGVPVAREDTEKALADNGWVWAKVVAGNQLPALAAEVKAIMLQKKKAQNGKKEETS